MDAGQNIKRGAGDGAPREKKLLCRGEHEQNVNGPGLSLGPYQASKRRQESRQSSAAQDPSAPACETDDPSSRTIHHSLRHSDNGPCAISRWSIPPPRDRPFGRKSHREAQHQAPNEGPLPANRNRGAFRENVSTGFFVARKRDTIFFQIVCCRHHRRDTKWSFQRYCNMVCCATSLNLSGCCYTSAVRIRYCTWSVGYSLTGHSRPVSRVLAVTEGASDMSYVLFGSFADSRLKNVL